MKKIVMIIISVLFVFGLCAAANAAPQTQVIDTQGYVGPNNTPTPTSSPQPSTSPDPQKPDPPEESPGAQVFKKMPLNKEVAPGETIDYEVSGFGNDMSAVMERYAITDILPNGLSLETVKLPAFTKGAGLTYSLVYETNQTKRTTLKSGISAAKAYSYDVPKMAAGEKMAYFSVVFENVPPGFGIGDGIVFRCRLDKKPPSKSIVNEASLSYRYNGKDYTKKAQTRGLEIGNVKGPKTGDTKMVLPYVVLAAAGTLVLAVILMKKRKASKTDGV